MAAHPNTPAIPDAVPDGRLLLAQIRHMGRTLEDIEKLRVQHEHRRGAFQREYQIALPPDSVSETLATAERGAALELIRLWRQHPLASWAKAQKGIGEKQIARLIAEIGDPADRSNVAKLWAYCGFDPNRKRRRGMSQEEALACGNPHAKTRAFLIASKCIMFDGKPDKRGRPRARSPYRNIYETRREATLGREGWTDGHKHGDALRIVAKTILRDLWIASRQGSAENQAVRAGGDDA